MKFDPKLLGWAAIILVVAGGINLGLVGLVGLDLIRTILGNILGRLVFIVIGAAAGYLIYLKFNKKADLQIF